MTSQLTVGDFSGAAPRLLQPDSVCDPLRTPAQAAPGKGSPGRQTRRKPRRELAGTMNGRKRSSPSWKTAFSTALFQGTILQRALMSDHSFCVVLSVTGKSKPTEQDPPRFGRFHFLLSKESILEQPCRAAASRPGRHRGCSRGQGTARRDARGGPGGGPGARPGRGAACAAPQRPPPALQPRAPPAEPQRKGQAGEGGAGEGAHANPAGGRSGEVEEELSKERCSPSSGQAAEVQRSLRSDKKAR